MVLFPSQHKNKQFQKHSSQPITHHGSEEIKPNKTKADMHQ